MGNEPNTCRRPGAIVPRENAAPASRRASGPPRARRQARDGGCGGQVIQAGWRNAEVRSEPGAYPHPQALRADDLGESSALLPLLPTVLCYLGFRRPSRTALMADSRIFPFFWVSSFLKSFFRGSRLYV